MKLQIPLNTSIATLYAPEILWISVLLIALVVAAAIGLAVAHSIARSATVIEIDTRLGRARFHTRPSIDSATWGSSFLTVPLMPLTNLAGTDDDISYAGMSSQSSASELIDRAFALHGERLLQARYGEIALVRREQASLGYLGKSSGQGLQIGRRTTERILELTKELIRDLDQILSAVGQSESDGEVLTSVRTRFEQLLRSMSAMPVMGAREYLGEDSSMMLRMVEPRIVMLWPATRLELEQAMDLVLLRHAKTSQEKEQLRGLTRHVGPVHFEDFSGHDFERLVVAFCIQRGWNEVEWIGQVGADGGRDVAATDETGRRVVLLCANYRRLDYEKASGDLGKLARGEYSLPDHVIVVCGGLVSAILREKVKAKAGEIGLSSCEVWSGVELEERIRKFAPNVLPRFCGGEPFPESLSDLEKWAANT